MSDLSEFLLERLAEDEAAARAAAEDEVSGDNARHGHPFGYWDALDAGYEEGIYLLGFEAVGDRDDNRTPATRHISRWDPARVLAECEAKRATVVTYRSFVQASESATDLGPKLTAAGAAAALEVVLKYLALPYADHEDYDPAWRP